MPDCSSNRAEPDSSSTRGWSAVPEFAKNIEEIDYIYLTHMHWDHVHGPSLDRLPKSATILIPKAHFRRMHADASMFGSATSWSFRMENRSR